MFFYAEGYENEILTRVQCSIKVKVIRIAEVGGSVDGCGWGGDDSQCVVLLGGAES